MMRKNRRFLAATIALLVLFALACTCSPSGIVKSLIPETPAAAVATKMVEMTVPAGDATSESEGEEGTVSSPELRECLSNLPVYPGAERDKEYEGNVDDIIDQIGALGQIEGGARVYTTADSIDEVVTFYRKRMPDKGWEKDVDFTTGQGGFMSWKKDGLSSQLFVGEEKGNTLILLGCGKGE